MFKEADSGCVSGGANNVMAADGFGGAAVVLGGEVDAVGADDRGTLYVASGGVVTTVDKGGEGEVVAHYDGGCIEGKDREWRPE